MVEKKYQLKTEKIRFDDGTSNDEHIKDILSIFAFKYITYKKMMVIRISLMLCKLPVKI